MPQVFVTFDIGHIDADTLVHLCAANCLLDVSSVCLVECIDLLAIGSVSDIYLLYMLVQALSFFICLLLFSCLVDALLGPSLEVDALRELAVIVDLETLHGVVIELEAFEIKDNCIGEVLEVRAPLSTDELVILFTVVLVVSLKDVWLDVEVKCFLDRLLVLDIERDGIEVFIALTNIRIAWLKRSCLIAQFASNRLL